MLKPGMQTSEGKTSMGIIVAGCFFIYYILSSRIPSTPSLDYLLANADSALEIAKAYAANNSINTANQSGSIFDGGAIIALLFSMYKTYGKYVDGRVTLKLNEGNPDNVEVVGTTNKIESRESLPANAPVTATPLTPVAGAFDSPTVTRSDPSTDVPMESSGPLINHVKKNKY